MFDVGLTCPSQVCIVTGGAQVTGKQATGIFKCQLKTDDFGWWTNETMCKLLGRNGSKQRHIFAAFAASIGSTASSFLGMLRALVAPLLWPWRRKVLELCQKLNQRVWVLVKEWFNWQRSRVRCTNV